jgi:hypothetical protein
MNRMSLENFKQELDQVREYLKHIEYVNYLADYSFDGSTFKSIDESKKLNDFKDHYRKFNTSKKIFEYKACIISLYGLLEKYVEIWIKEYLDSLSDLVTRYSQITEKIKNNNFELSLKLINNIISRDNVKFHRLTKEDVLQNLSNCITDNDKYKFNTEAFIISSGNLKHNKIVILFEYIEIKLNELLRKNQTLIKLIEYEQQTENIANIHTDILYNRINDLVERRNEIAHGSETLNIFSLSELEPYIEFLEKYCQAIFEVLVDQFIKQKSIYKFQKIEKVVKIFNNEILAFEVADYTIKVGDTLIIETIEGQFHEKTIDSIELDNESYQELIISEKKNIAISVAFRINKNQTFYVVKK